MGRKGLPKAARYVEERKVDSISTDRKKRGDLDGPLSVSLVDLDTGVDVYRPLGVSHHDAVSDFGIELACDGERRRAFGFQRFG